MLKFGLVLLLVALCGCQAQTTFSYVCANDTSNVRTGELASIHRFDLPGMPPVHIRTLYPRGPTDREQLEPPCNWFNHFCYDPCTAIYHFGNYTYEQFGGGVFFLQLMPAFVDMARRFGWDADNDSWGGSEEAGAMVHEIFVNITSQDRSNWNTKPVVQYSLLQGNTFTAVFNFMYKMHMEHAWLDEACSYRGDYEEWPYCVWESRIVFYTDTMWNTVPYYPFWHYRPWSVSDSIAHAKRAIFARYKLNTEGAAAWKYLVEECQMDGGLYAYCEPNPFGYLRIDWDRDWDDRQYYFSEPDILEAFKYDVNTTTREWTYFTEIGDIYGSFNEECRHGLNGTRAFCLDFIPHWDNLTMTPNVDYSGPFQFIYGNYSTNAGGRLDCSVTVDIIARGFTLWHAFLGESSTLSYFQDFFNYYAGGTNTKLYDYPMLMNATTTYLPFGNHLEYLRRVSCYDLRRVLRDDLFHVHTNPPQGVTTYTDQCATGAFVGGMANGFLNGNASLVCGATSDLVHFEANHLWAAVLARVNVVLTKGPFYSVQNGLDIFNDFFAQSFCPGSDSLARASTYDSYISSAKQYATHIDMDDGHYLTDQEYADFSWFYNYVFNYLLQSTTPLAGFEGLWPYMAEYTADIWFYLGKEKWTSLKVVEAKCVAMGLSTRRPTLMSVEEPVKITSEKIEMGPNTFDVTRLRRNSLTSKFFNQVLKFSAHDHIPLNEIHNIAVRAQKRASDLWTAGRNTLVDPLLIKQFGYLFQGFKPARRQIPKHI